MFQEAFNVQGVVPHNEAVVAMALETYGTSTALIMAFGMLANILIARYTKLKYIFLTGHHTLYMAAMIAVILVVAGFKGTSSISRINNIGFCYGIFQYCPTNYAKDYRYRRYRIWTLPGTTGYVLSAWVGKMVGKDSQSTEEWNFLKVLDS